MFDHLLYNIMKRSASENKCNFKLKYLVFFKKCTCYGKILLYLLNIQCELHVMFLEA